MPCQCSVWVDGRLKAIAEKAWTSTLDGKKAHLAVASEECRKCMQMGLGALASRWNRRLCRSYRHQIHPFSLISPQQS